MKITEEIYYRIMAKYGIVVTEGSFKIACLEAMEEYAEYYHEQKALKEKTIDFTCPECDGEGYTSFIDQGEPELTSRCHKCKGKGRILTQEEAIDYIEQDEIREAEFRKNIKSHLKDMMED
jgi:hypothetical protein